ERPEGVLGTEARALFLYGRAPNGKGLVGGVPPIIAATASPWPHDSTDLCLHRGAADDSTAVERSREMVTGTTASASRRAVSASERRREFAPDSSLEQAGFEPLVPFREETRPSRPSSIVTRFFPARRSTGVRSRGASSRVARCRQRLRARERESSANPELLIVDGFDRDCRCQERRPYARLTGPSI